MRLLELLRRRERRRSRRIPGEGVVAFYWTGGIQDGRTVREINLHGACVVAPETFYPGTLIQMLLENRSGDEANGEAFRHICLVTRALRMTPDGFCVEFLVPDVRERVRLRRFLAGLKPGRH